MVGLKAAVVMVAVVIITSDAAVIATDANDAIAQRLRRDDIVAQCVEVLGALGARGSSCFCFGFGV